MHCIFASVATRIIVAHYSATAEKTGSDLYLHLENKTKYVLQYRSATFLFYTWAFLLEENRLIVDSLVAMGQFACRYSELVNRGLKNIQKPVNRDGVLYW